VEDQDIPKAMPAMNEQRKFRRDPHASGTIVRVALPSGEYAYLCYYGGIHFWLYGFLTDFPTREAKYFDPAEWKAPLKWSELLTVYRDVCRIELSPDKRVSVDTWRYIDWEDSEIPTKIRVCPGKTGIHRMGTPEEIIGMHKDVWLSGEGIVSWILSYDKELRRVHVPPEDRDVSTEATNVADAEGYAEDESRLIEIQVPNADEALFAKRDDLEEELVMELQVADCGDECGHGSQGDFAFDIAVEVNPRRIKTALRIIRRVLKKYKVPDSVWIREFDPESEEPIEHPLEPPPKAK